MKILMTSLHKGAIQLTNKKGKNAECINILEVVKLAELLRREGHEVTIASTRNTDVATAFNELNANDFDRVLIMNSKIHFPRRRGKQASRFII